MLFFERKQMNIELSFDKSVFQRALKNHRLATKVSFNDLAAKLQISPSELEAAEEGTGILDFEVTRRLLKDMKYQEFTKYCLLLSSQHTPVINWRMKAGSGAIKNLKKILMPEEIKILD